MYIQIMLIPTVCFLIMHTQQTMHIYISWTYKSCTNNPCTYKSYAYKSRTNKSCTHKPCICQSCTYNYAHTIHAHINIDIPIMHISTYIQIMYIQLMHIRIMYIQKRVYFFVLHYFFFSVHMHCYMSHMVNTFHFYIHLAKISHIETYFTCFSVCQTL